MSWQAEMLGIDLDELQRERFGHLDHYLMVQEHEERVKQFADDRRYDRYREIIRLAEEKITLENAAVSEARERNLSLKPRKHYRFTDKQLEIAMKVLANGS